MCLIWKYTWKTNWMQKKTKGAMSIEGLGVIDPTGSKFQRGTTDWAPARKPSTSPHLPHCLHLKTCDILLVPTRTNQEAKRTTMPPKGSIFRGPNAQHFQLVHRSQQDPLINDPEASQRVLKPMDRGNDSRKVCITYVRCNVLWLIIATIERNLSCRTRSDHR